VSGGATLFHKLQLCSKNSVGPCFASTNYKCLNLRRTDPSTNLVEVGVRRNPAKTAIFYARHPDWVSLARHREYVCENEAAVASLQLLFWYLSVIISVVFRVSPGGGAAHLVVDKKNTQCGWEMKRGRKWHAHKQRQVNETNKWIAIDWQHTHIKSNAFSLDHCVHVTYSSWRFFFISLSFALATFTAAWERRRAVRAADSNSPK